MGFVLSDIALSTSAFQPHGRIPVKHTGEGEDVSPALRWTNVPDGTRGFALICHDPDAPLVSPRGTYGFVHWALYNIPGSVTELAEGTSDYTAGRNDTDNVGYNGPMPPGGHGIHQYYFWILALSEETRLDAGLTLWELLEKLEPSIIGMNRLVGTYERQ